MAALSSTSSFSGRDVGDARVALEQLLVDVGGPDLRALGGERQRAGVADALAGRSDERGFPFNRMVCLQFGFGPMGGTRHIVF
jgi:hypothetical protein